MARVPMVTRTIVTTKANVLCLDIEKGEPFNKEVILPRTYKDEKALMKKVSPLVDNETTKAVHIVDKVEEETLYGMLEQDFIKYAKVLKGRGSTGEAETENADEVDSEEDYADTESVDSSEAGTDSEQ